ncbi:MAG: hypothetical protein HKN20_06745, partial [Gemmatimonadetes bacterium]|nr:hypothetical protein [Gemmatimonadota bacterium]
MTQLFTDADRDRIEEAVRAAEARTAGEIVPVIVAQSDSYPLALRRAGLIGLAGGAVVFELLRLVWS